MSRTNAGVQHYYPPNVSAASSASSSSEGMSGAMQQMYRRLSADGMSSEVEDRLMLMKDNLVKTARNRQTYKREAESMDCVELGVEHGVQTRPLLRSDWDDHEGVVEHQGSATVAPPPLSASASAGGGGCGGGQPLQQQGGGGSGGGAANEEWNLMFGGPSDHEVLIGIEKV